MVGGWGAEALASAASVSIPWLQAAATSRSHELGSTSSEDVENLLEEVEALESDLARERRKNDILQAQLAVQDAAGPVTPVAVEAPRGAIELEQLAASAADELRANLAGPPSEAKLREQLASLSAEMRQVCAPALAQACQQRATENSEALQLAVERVDAVGDRSRDALKAAKARLASAIKNTTLTRTSILTAKGVLEGLLAERAASAAEEAQHQKAITCLE